LKHFQNPLEIVERGEIDNPNTYMTSHLSGMVQARQ